MPFEIKDYYKDGVCPDCGDDIPDDTLEGEACLNCGHIFWTLLDDLNEEE